MKIRVLFCVPVYNNPDTVGEVINSLLELGTNDILIVDDGSKIPVEELIPKNERVFLITNKENLGKGKAVRNAFSWAIPKGYTHMITVDGDGQHPASEAMKI